MGGGFYELRSRAERRARRFYVAAAGWSVVWLLVAVIGGGDWWLGFALLHMAFIAWQVRLMKHSYRREHEAFQLDWLEAELLS